MREEAFFGGYQGDCMRSHIRSRIKIYETDQPIMPSRMKQALALLTLMTTLLLPQASLQASCFESFLSHESRVYPKIEKMLEDYLEGQRNVKETAYKLFTNHPILMVEYALNQRIERLEKPSLRETSPRETSPRETSLRETVDQIIEPLQKPLQNFLGRERPFSIFEGRDLGKLRELQKRFTGLANAQARKSVNAILYELGKSSSHGAERKLVEFIREKLRGDTQIEGLSARQVRMRGVLLFLLQTKEGRDFFANLKPDLGIHKSSRRLKPENIRAFLKELTSAMDFHLIPIAKILTFQVRFLERWAEGAQRHAELKSESISYFAQFVILLNSLRENAPEFFLTLDMRPNHRKQFLKELNKIVAQATTIEGEMRPHFNNAAKYVEAMKERLKEYREDHPGKVGFEFTKKEIKTMDWLTKLDQAERLEGHRLQE
jgi:hypothetical protein